MTDSVSVLAKSDSQLCSSIHLTASAKEGKFRIVSWKLIEKVATNFGEMHKILLIDFPDKSSEFTKLL